MREIEYAANMVLPQWGVTCFYETFVHKQTTVLLLNICAKIPHCGNTQNVGCNLYDAHFGHILRIYRRWRHHSH